MGDRRVEVQWLGAAQGHRPVHTVTLLPVERHRPSLVARDCPPFREPQQWILVAAVLHEFNPLAVADRPVRKPIRLEEYAMARCLAVEGEVAPLMSDLNQPSVERQ